MSTEALMVTLYLPETILKRVNLYQQTREIESVPEAVVAILTDFFAIAPGAIASPPVIPTDNGLEEESEDEPDEILYAFLDPEE